MNRKNKKFALIALILFCSIICSYGGDRLTVKIKNSTLQALNINSISSGKTPETELLQIPKNVTKSVCIDFGKKYFLNLIAKNRKNELIAEIRIFHNYTCEKDYDFFVPGGGPLSNWGCMWNKNRVRILKIEGNEYYSWLFWIPFFFPVYNADVELEILPEVNSLTEKEETADFPLEFTLFAVNKGKSLKEIHIDTAFETSKSYKKGELNFAKWGIDEYISLDPVFYREGKTVARWVDIFIHNYSAKTFILYGIDEKPKDDHIEFGYKEGLRENFTVFYPPQSQLRGPGFKFEAAYNNEEVILSPKTSEPEKKDKYYLIIGEQADLSKNTLEYIPIEVKTGIRLGKMLKNGANVKAFKDHAYQVNFIPVNASFYIKSAKISEIKNKIRVPISENGEPIFELIPMKDIKILAEPQYSKIKIPLKNKVAVKYKIMGKSEKSGKEYSYRLILTAPPFLAGNTPGNFSPGQRILSDSDIGNFNRYPLHFYLIPLDKDGNELSLKGGYQRTELPAELIGSIEYFVSDS